MASKRSPKPVEAAGPSSNVRSLITLALVIHLFVVAVTITANLRPSPLQAQLVYTLSPYAQPLNLKLSDEFSHKLFHYTHGDPSQDDHFLEVEFLEGSRSGEIVRLPEGQWRATAGRHRYRAFTHMLGFYAHQENDSLLGKLIQGFAPHFLGDEADARAMVRVRRHRPMPLGARVGDRQNPLDPADAAYLETIYEGRIWTDGAGNYFLAKVEAQSQVAPLRQESDDE